MVLDVPEKQPDDVLLAFIEKKVLDEDYVFVHHAKVRLDERNITDIDVLDILENKPNRNRKRNSKKDSFHKDHHQWNYCIEGSTLDDENIRIIVSFDVKFLLIITVIRL